MGGLEVRMSWLSLLRSHDPYWEVDGPAARREHRREWIVSRVAFVAAVTAIVGAGAAWCIQLGVAAGVGINASLALG